MSRFAERTRNAKSAASEQFERWRLQTLGRIIIAASVATLLGGCASALPPGLRGAVSVRTAAAPQPMALAEVAPGPRSMDGMIARYAAEYDVPEALIRRIIVRESGYNPKARNGPYWGLMQIRYDTARSMGYSGPASGLLDADTNLRYGVKYLSGAYKVGERNSDQAVRNYASGYYYTAKAKGLLAEVGLD
jgi:soluble lytic murein transglycosylase-like protein